MLASLVHGGARLHLLVILLAAAAVAGCAILLRNASVDTLPELGEPYVEIQTEALGLSATEVEELITVPLRGQHAQRRGMGRVDQLALRCPASLRSS